MICLLPWPGDPEGPQSPGPFGSTGTGAAGAGMQPALRDPGSRDSPDRGHSSLFPETLKPHGQLPHKPSGTLKSPGELLDHLDGGTLSADRLHKNLPEHGLGIGHLKVPGV